MSNSNNIISGNSSNSSISNGGGNGGGEINSENFKKFLESVGSFFRSVVDSKAFWISVSSAAAALLFYKGFMEKESDLNRRLNRVEKNRKPVRIWVDGCFDLFHFGHANALRQARLLGDELVVGINSDDEIRKIKGPPLMNDEERHTLVSACKWVDKVVTGVPYVLDTEYMKKIFDEFEIDFVVHGDDPCLLPDGSDVYALAKSIGKFKIIKRTEGVSTTDIVGRILLNCKLHHHYEDQEQHDEEVKTKERRLSNMSIGSSHATSTNISKFLPTSRRITQFSSAKSPKPTDVVVYIDGDWDLFHAGHVDLLKYARNFGDFLIVGIHRDSDVNRVMGENYPILNLHERVLSVLSCRYVDEVIIGAPWEPQQDMFTSLNITVVLESDEYELMKPTFTQNVPRHKVAMDLKLYRKIHSPRKLTTIDIVDRVYDQMAEFTKKYEKKAKKEKDYVEHKQYVAEL